MSTNHFFNSFTTDKEFSDSSTDVTHQKYSSCYFDSVIVTRESLPCYLQEVLEGSEGSAFPAARVVPTKGELFWLIDDPAAASLTIQVERLGSEAKL